MSMIKEKNKIYTVEMIEKIIKENTDFDVYEDITARTKRDDVLAFILECDAGRIKQDLEEDDIELDINEAEEEYISELMNRADEYAVEVEESLPEDLMAYYYSYEYDDEEELIKLVLVVAFESLGEKKLKEVGNRMITMLGE